IRTGRQSHSQKTAYRCCDCNIDAMPVPPTVFLMFRVLGNLPIQILPITLTILDPLIVYHPIRHW
ncbi:MAG: hypothetical protein WCA35_31915, partial [Kovacikia sp.]